MSLILALVLAASAATGTAFDQTFALGAYGSAWQGSYGAGGVGGQLRIEPFRHVGVDLFSEHLLVATPEGIRHDHPIGFHLYTPIPVGPVRLLPFVGSCAVASFIESPSKDAPGADDVLFGSHAGLQFEAPLGDLSLFARAKAVGWIGHDRAVQGWTGSISSNLNLFAVAQVDLGLSVHFGAR